MRTSQMRLSLSLLVAALVLLAGVNGQTGNTYCCTSGGIEYQCAEGTTCCECNECCTGSEFCWSSQSICVQYSLIIISPITVVLFFAVCIWNYKTKRQIMKDQESLRILEKKGEELVSNENRNEKSRLINPNDEQVTQRDNGQGEQRISVSIDREEEIDLQEDNKQTLNAPLLQGQQEDECGDETILPNQINISQ